CRSSSSLQRCPSNPVSTSAIRAITIEHRSLFARFGFADRRFAYRAHLPSQEHLFGPLRVLSPEERVVGLRHRAGLFQSEYVPARVLQSAFRSSLEEHLLLAFVR